MQRFPVIAHYLSNYRFGQVNALILGNLGKYRRISS